MSTTFDETPIIDASASTTTNTNWQYESLHPLTRDYYENTVGQGMFYDWVPNSDGTLGLFYKCAGNEGHQFKMFIPPGTITANISYNHQYNTMFSKDHTHDSCMSLCWGEAPEIWGWVPKAYLDVGLVKYFSYHLGQNGTDMGIRLIYDYGAVLDEKAKRVEEGDWLYVYFNAHDSNTTHRQHFLFYVDVDMEIYSNWYYKASWDEETGDPLTFGLPKTETPAIIDPFYEAYKKDPNTTYPQPWPYEYPLLKPFPYPFGE